MSEKNQEDTQHQESAYQDDNAQYEENTEYQEVAEYDDAEPSPTSSQKPFNIGQRLIFNTLMSAIPLVILLIVVFFLTSDDNIKYYNMSAILIATIIAVAVSILLNLGFAKIFASRVTRLKNNMVEIANGNFDIEIKDDDEREELGQMGGVLKIFQDNAMEKALLDEMLESTNEMLKKNNALIEESIMYARKIQHNTMPDENMLTPRFHAHHLLWNPRDIVGGDFFLAYELPNDDFVVIVGDCTGHGVPGAMLTMLVSAITSAVVYDLDFSSMPEEIPGRILAQLHHHMQAALKQDQGEIEESDEGLEACVTYMPKGADVIHCAAARHSLIHVGLDENNKIVETSVLPAEKKSIAYSRYEPFMDFESYEVDLTMYDRNVFYSVSDGVVDQVGSEIRRAYGKKRVMKFIEENAHLTPKEQGKLLANDIVMYMGDQSQRDDQTVFIFETLKIGEEA